MLMKTVKAACHFQNDVELQDRLKQYQEAIQPVYDGLTGKASSTSIKFKDGTCKFIYLFSNLGCD